MIVNIYKTIPVYGIIRYKQIAVPCSCSSLNDFFEGYYTKIENGSPMDQDAHSLPTNLKAEYAQWKVDNAHLLAGMLAKYRARRV